MYFQNVVSPQKNLERGFLECIFWEGILLSNMGTRSAVQQAACARPPVLTARPARAMSVAAPAGASMDTRHAHNPCSPAEINSCCSVLRGSPHASIKLLPNHHISADAQLHGFHFSCHVEDHNSVLLVSVNMCTMVSMYE